VECRYGEIYVKTFCTDEPANVCKFSNPRFMQLGVDFAFVLGSPFDVKKDTATNVAISTIFPHNSKSEITLPTQANHGPVHVFDYRQCLTRLGQVLCIARAERDDTRAETRFHLSPKRTSPFKSVGASVQSTAGSQGVPISLSNAG